MKTTITEEDLKNDISQREDDFVAGWEAGFSHAEKVLSTFLPVTEIALGILDAHKKGRDRDV